MGIPTFSHAFVTGASSGIGETITLALAAQTRRLTLVARREARLRQVADSARDESVTITCLPLDISVGEGLEAAQCGGSR